MAQFYSKIRITHYPSPPGRGDHLQLAIRCPLTYKSATFSTGTSYSIPDDFHRQFPTVTNVVFSSSAFNLLSNDNVTANITGLRVLDAHGRNVSLSTTPSTTMLMTSSGPCQKRPLAHHHSDACAFGRDQRTSGLSVLEHCHVIICVRWM